MLMRPVTYSIDDGGILEVTAKETSTGTDVPMPITEERGRFSRDDIERMLREAEANKAYDETVRVGVGVVGVRLMGRSVSVSVVGWSVWG